MITKEDLRSETIKNLAQMAKAKGVTGCHSMRKEDLIKRLLALSKKAGTQKNAPKNAPKKASKGASSKTTTANKSGKLKSSAAKPTPKAVSANEKKSSSKAASVGTKVAAAKSTKVASAPAMAVKETTKKISQPKSATAKSTSSPAVKKAQRKPTDPTVIGKLRTIQQQRAAAKDLAFFRQQVSASEEPKKDRLVLFVRDPYWLQAYWEITKTGVERARAALAEHWHSAEPVLRVLVAEEDGTTGSTEQVEREIKIHGGVNSWYIDVQDPPKSFRVIIGYLASNKKFHAIAQSNLVRTPVPGSSDHVDHNWTDMSDIGDRVFSLSGGFDEAGSSALRDVFEEKLRRPMSRSALSRYGTASIPGKPSEMDFAVDAELLIFGQTHPSAEVSISGEPVRLREDGSFTVRMGLPDKRQVFPVSSTSFDGTYTYTTVLAIERNTKVMEPMSAEPGDEF